MPDQADSTASSRDSDLVAGARAARRAKATFTDVGIELPNFGNVVRVDPTGKIELLLKLSPTS